MKVIVFDFDGVIIPSEEIKQSGYSRMFSKHGEDVPKLAITEARNEFADAKGNRFDIIRSIFSRMGHIGNIDALVTEYAQRFDAIVSHHIRNFQVRDDVLAMLEKLSRSHALYINSNTPDVSLHTALKSLGIERYFKGVYGSNLSKTESLRAIAQIEGIAPRDMVFIGDGEGDRRAAEEYGCTFVGIATSLNGWGNRAPGTHEVLNSVAEFDVRADDRGQAVV